MSLKSITEIVLHIESFKNIDLTKRGVYRVHF